jgi:short-subunit dehydrogenase
MSVRLEGSRALLTGATGGIGGAIARALHARGAEVLATGRRDELLDSLKADLGERVEVIAADLADGAELSRLARQARPVDVLVANAALPGTGRLESFSSEQIERVLDVNLRAPIQLARELLPDMLERRSGHIVLISSLSGKIATPSTSVYCATKFGLRGFGFALHQELAGTGVGVTTIFPGFIREAGMFVESGAKLPPGIGTSAPQEVAEAVIEGIERNRAEIDVAPLPMRSGAKIFTAAPSIGAAISRRLGGSRVAASVAQGQREKRT